MIWPYFKIYFENLKLNTTRRKILDYSVNVLIDFIGALGSICKLVFESFHFVYVRDGYFNSKAKASVVSLVCVIFLCNQKFLIV